MEVLIEQIIIYGLVFLFGIGVFYFYFKKQNLISKATTNKVEIAKSEGLFEPVSLHPFIDLNTCIGSAACVAECPEKDILGIVNNQATVINATSCVGHGACFHACPVEAISLRIGTEKRGVDLPHVNQTFESNVKGIFIAGELGGMGLIKNSVEQGQQAIDNLAKGLQKSKDGNFDVVIIGAGPAGISATLKAKQLGLNCVTLEQDSLGGTVYTFPRSKIVMTAPMNLPLYGKVKLFDTSKDELLDLWNSVIDKHNLQIREHTKVDQIIPQPDGSFKVITAQGKPILTQSVLLAIGRRGTPRKLNIPGEDLSKVAYRLLDAEQIKGKNIIVVGGGDSAVESALLLKDENNVILSYRKDKFARIKPKNRDKINQAIKENSINFIFNSNLVSIEDKHALISKSGEDGVIRVENDLVYIFAGGELPTKFLEKAGIEIKKRFGYIMKKHT